MNRQSLYLSILLTVLTTSTATISSVSNLPTIDLEHSTNKTTVLEGDTAVLECRIKNLGQYSVGWVNKENANILTVRRYTVTSDDRFSLATNQPSTEWTLRIRNVQKRDAGRYCCMIATDPMTEHDVYLTVSAIEASIVGNKEIYIKNGDSLNLTCNVNRSLSSRDSITWYLDEKMINLDESSQTRIETRNLNSTSTTSQLLIPAVSLHDYGNYTCDPSNADPASVLVYVIQNEVATTGNYDGADTGSKGYFSSLADSVCYYTSLFC